MQREKSQNEIIKIPIRAEPYQHQVEAFQFVCNLFGVFEGGDDFGKSNNKMHTMQQEIRKNEKQDERLHFTKKAGDVYEHFQK